MTVESRRMFHLDILDPDDLECIQFLLCDYGAQRDEILKCKNLSEIYEKVTTSNRECGNDLIQEILFLTDRYDLLRQMGGSKEHMKNYYFGKLLSSERVLRYRIRMEMLPNEEKVWLENKDSKYWSIFDYFLHTPEGTSDNWEMVANDYKEFTQFGETNKILYRFKSEAKRVIPHVPCTKDWYRAAMRFSFSQTGAYTRCPEKKNCCLTINNLTNDSHPDVKLLRNTFQYLNGLNDHVSEFTELEVNEIDDVIKPMRKSSYNCIIYCEFGHHLNEERTDIVLSKFRTSKFRTSKFKERANVPKVFFFFTCNKSTCTKPTEPPPPSAPSGSGDDCQTTVLNGQTDTDGNGLGHPLSPANKRVADYADMIWCTIDVGDCKTYTQSNKACDLIKKLCELLRNFRHRNADIDSILRTLRVREGDKVKFTHTLEQKCYI